MMFRRGRRLFTVGSIGIAVIGLLHGIGHFSSPTDPGLKVVETAMAAQHMDMGPGFNPSLLGIFTALSITFSLLFWGIAAFNLIVAASADTTQELIGRLAWANAIVMGVLTGLYLYYRILPPFATILVIVVLFLLAAIRSPRSE